MPVGGSLNKFINKFNSEANKHQETQSNNPFSSSFSGGQRPRVSKEEYGRPKAGSKTEARGLQAKSHINKEILELCNIIYELALLNRNESDDENDIDDKNIVVTFGELFERRDDDELIVLLKPIKEINAIAKGNSQPTSCQDLEEQELT
ncbi:actin-binding Rho-activating protein isoform X2 [Halyomorpha halys]|uniref:actin-binding Rho-activating protein isoform X2 n=1 Tax=Halyomorpha halys TaxID=286706 RepID=UPI0006D4C80B|nr:actin-binding Rho-activating protein isoform X2 [Halyomorpha halys]